MKIALFPNDLDEDQKRYIQDELGGTVFPDVERPKPTVRYQIVQSAYLFRAVEMKEGQEDLVVFFPRSFDGMFRSSFSLAPTLIAIQGDNIVVAKREVEDGQPVFTCAVMSRKRFFDKSLGLMSTESRTPMPEVILTVLGQGMCKLSLAEMSQLLYVNSEDLSAYRAEGEMPRSQEKGTLWRRPFRRSTRSPLTN